VPIKNWDIGRMVSRWEIMNRRYPCFVPAFFDAVCGWPFSFPAINFQRWIFVTRSALYCLIWASALLVTLGGCGPSSGIPTADVGGTITINGKPVAGVQVKFVPEAKIRPSVALTDSRGNYEAQFVSSQSGVVLGPCVVQLSVFRGDSPHNYLPKEFNENASENPDFNLDIAKEGLKFDYDIKYDGEIPPYQP